MKVQLLLIPPMIVFRKSKQRRQDGATIPRAKACVVSANLTEAIITYPAS